MAEKPQDEFQTTQGKRAITNGDAVSLPSHLNPLFHSPAHTLAKRACLQQLLCVFAADRFLVV